MILDQNMKPIKTIYEYSSGTTLRPIQKLIQIDDGTFVGVDSTIYSGTISTEDIMNNEKRFIMLNNFSTMDANNDYSVVLRKSYIFPSAYRNIFVLDMVKNPNSSHYLLAGKTLYLYNGNYIDGARIIDLKIEVGSSNEWSQAASSSTTWWQYGGFYGEFDTDDNATFKAIITRNASPVVLYSWNGNTTSQTLTEILTEGNGVSPYVDSVSMKNQVSFIDYDNVYFVINNQRFDPSVIPRYIGLYKYTYSTDIVKNIYFKEIGNFDWNGSKEGIFIQALNGELYVNYCDNYNSTNKTANFNYQRLENDVWDPILITQDKKYQMEFTINYTYNIYNLVTNIMMSEWVGNTYWNLQKIKEVYNNLNYNGTEYDCYNSLIPNSSTLYNDSNLIFARNLYNSTYYRNTTTSTLEIPNSMLNNIDINNSKLLGKTNTTLVNDTNTINKNIYETLYINFVNNINVIDQDTGILYNAAASNITKNINDTNNDSTTMENKRIGKIRINFQDGTTRIQTVSLTSTGTNEYLIRVTIYASDYIDTIEIISKDETETYMEIDGSGLPINNYHDIRERLKIE